MDYQECELCAGGGKCYGLNKPGSNVPVNKLSECATLFYHGIPLEDRNVEGCSFRQLLIQVGKLKPRESAKESNLAVCSG